MAQCTITEHDILSLARSWIGFGMFEDRECCKSTHTHTRQVHAVRASEHESHVFQMLTSLLDYDHAHACDFIRATKDEFRALREQVA